MPASPVKTVLGRPPAAGGRQTDQRPVTWRVRLGWLALAVLLAGVYALTLSGGVGRGDAAELQYMCPLLGICHPPGYAIEVVVGKLFSLLPIGPNVAWRINLMQAVCGVGGCLALFGTLRRLTGQLWPGLVAGATLGLSSVYWRHSVVAEVYVFYGLFLLTGVYTAVRFLASGKGGWLLATALCLGICVGNRPSAVLLLPAFVGLWWGHRREVRLGWRRIAASLLIAVAPFAFSVAYVTLRENPTLLHARDDAYRDQLLNIRAPNAGLPFTAKLRESIVYCSGAKWSKHEYFAGITWRRLTWDLDKLAWMLSGRDAFGERFPLVDRYVDPHAYKRRLEQGRGTSVGLAGIVAALIGLRAWRRQRGAVLLGLGLVAGNLFLYVYVHPVDNLDFTLSTAAGLAILVGLGVSHAPAARPGRAFAAYQRACALIPAFLLVANFAVIRSESSTPEEMARRVGVMQRTPLPDKSVILANYTEGNALRYLYWIEAKRPDVPVLMPRGARYQTELAELAEALKVRGHSVIIGTDSG